MLNVVGFGSHLYVGILREIKSFKDEFSLFCGLRCSDLHGESKIAAIICITFVMCYVISFVFNDPLDMDTPE